MIRKAMGALLAICALGWTAAQAETVGIGTMAAGTLSHSTGSTIAKVLNEEAGLQSRVQPNTGETVILPLIDNGEFDFGIANVLEGAEAYLGHGQFDGNALENLRIAAVLYPLRTALFVRKDSGIETIADLEGKRITHGFPAMGTVEVVLDALLANGGLEDGDYEKVLVPNVIKGADAFVNGRADAFFFAVGAGKVSEVDASVGIRMLSGVDEPEAVERMNEVFPYGYLLEVQPNPAFAGVLEPGFVLAYDNLLLTGTHVSDELAGKVAKGLYENKEALAAGFKPFLAFNPENVVKDDMPVPFHDGVRAWYESR